MKIKMAYVIGVMIFLAIVLAGYLFYLQQQTTPQSGTPTKFEQYAKDLGLNVQQFSSCLNTEKYKPDIQNDVNDGNSYGIQGTPTLFVNGKETSYSPNELTSAINSALANPNANVEIKTGTNTVRGSANAPVTIVEFSDFQCPACGNAEPIIEQTLQQYQGKVKLYYRDFPLTTPFIPTNMHPFALKAAEAARCAGEQGKFWEYHDTLFAKQQEWTAG